MGIVDAFARYGARLTNQNWSVSAFAPDGSLVISLWEPRLKKGQGDPTNSLVFEDKVSQWMDGTSGKSEVLEHLRRAHEQRAKVHLVIAHPAKEDVEKVGTIRDERKIRKDYSDRQDLLGFVDRFDGDAVRIVFRRAG